MGVMGVMGMKKRLEAGYWRITPHSSLLTPHSSLISALINISIGEAWKN